MSWEDEFAWGNNKGENTLDPLPPVIFTSFKCEGCGNEYHPDSSYTYDAGVDEFGEIIMSECTSTRYIGQKI